MPGTYTVLVERSFEKDFDALPADVQRHINKKLGELANDPRPPGSKKLAGADDLHRVRVGDYRVIYAIRDRELLVLLLRAAHRREVYR